MTILSRQPVIAVLFLVTLIRPLSAQTTAPSTQTAQHAAATKDPFRRENLAAWCIVPFDSAKRTPKQRAEMLKELGIHQLAYDYRAEQIPTFEDELTQLKAHDIKLLSWWFPTTLNDEAKLILSVLKKHDVKTQLWVTGGGEPTASADEQRARVIAEANRIRPIAEAAAEIGCSVGLYNHGGWFGEPENQIAIINELKLRNVGIVYNLHHGHEHLDRFRELLSVMKPHLLALNLNGMIPKGDKLDQKIIPIGAGTLDATLLKTIRDSGYDGPIGILNHTDNDAEARLRDNLDGLDWLLPQLEGKPAGTKPKYRSWTPPSKQAKASMAPSVSRLVDSNDTYRKPPITVVCDAILRHKEVYNILVASDTKASGLHWELFSRAGDGVLACYLPGHRPELIASSVNICDDKPHRHTMIYEPNRVRLLIDGQLVADEAIERTEMHPVPGQFAIGRLVEGGLQCFGDIGLVEIYRGAADIEKLSDPIYTSSLERLGQWRFAPIGLTNSIPNAKDQSTAFLEFDGAQVQLLAAEASQGDASRGIAIFASAKSACLSCHKIGTLGGSVGPELTNLGKQRTAEQIIESILWPNRAVEDKYKVTQILTSGDEQVRGYTAREDDSTLVLLDPATGVETSIAKEEIEHRRIVPSLMPEGLVNAWSREQILDLTAFLTDLGHHQRLRAELAASVLEHAQPHDPAPFPFDRRPLNESHWPSWNAKVNRDRIYDFYNKQANHFRTQDIDQKLLMEFPGLDGGNQGHWGNQTEDSWASDDWNSAVLGTVQSGVFQAPNKPAIARAVCLQLGDESDLFVCFDPDTLTYPALWHGKFLKFSSVRHGFVSGIMPAGDLLSPPQITKPNEPFEYQGFYRIGKRIAFAYKIGNTEYLDAPWSKDGKFVREFAPRASHSLHDQLVSSPAQWPHRLETNIKLGNNKPYAVDTIELPFDNPWRAPIYCGGHDFFSDGSALVATMQGDVWHVSEFSSADLNRTPNANRKAIWRRYASGLHHTLGVKIDKDGIFIQCRDQLTRLHDLNHDGEADFYECYSNAFETSPAGHDYICGLERDSAGNFYMASGNQGLVKIAANGKQAQVIAEGFRNPDGLGIYPDGVVTVPCSEGEWTPASMICAVPPSEIAADVQTPFHGYRGQRFVNRPIARPELPLVYLPRALDNSAGGQVYIDSDKWGPLAGNMVHLSFGTGSHMLLLRDEVNGQLQGAVVPLPGEFASSVHRGRFSPFDGQLYVTGMSGWGSYTTDTGCFQRVRYTGGSVQLPSAFHVHANGVAVEFTELLDKSFCEQVSEHFAQCWNYRYSAAYGSAEYSALHYGTRGHDHLRITSSHVLGDGRTLFLEIPELLPCNQLHLQIATDANHRIDMFVTCNRLDEPRNDFPNALAVKKQDAVHPIDQDMTMATRRVPNPWRHKIPEARIIRIEAGKNLSFNTRVLHAKAGEPIALTFENPDVVPHNWVLIKPGKLQQIGEDANKLVADPEALIRHYVPQSNDVICFTDIAESHVEETIYFRAPKEPGRYPFLCTFPGHWMVMNGEMVIEE